MLELINILLQDNAVEIIKSLDNKNELENYLPELTNLKNKTNTKSHKDHYLHSLGVLQNSIDFGFPIEYRLASILHDIGKTKTEKKITPTDYTYHDHEEVGSTMIKPIWERLHLPEELYIKVFYITKYHGKARILSDDVTDSAIRRFIKDVGLNWKQILLFSKADITTSKLIKKLTIQDKIDKLIKRIELFLISEEEAKFRLVLNGNEIATILNIKPPSKHLGIIRDDITDKIKSGVLVNEKEELIDYVLFHYKL